MLTPAEQNAFGTDPPQEACRREKKQQGFTVHPVSWLF